MKKLTILIFAFFSILSCYSQSIKDFVDNSDEKKIKKKIVVDAMGAPVSKKGIGYKAFSDGHGKNPFFTSKDQLPKKIALATFYVLDNGTKTTIHQVSVTTHSLTNGGGNYFANQFLSESFPSIKEAFSKAGIELIDIQQALDTKQKQDFYRSYKPDASAVGKFIGIEEFRKAEMVNTADFYRCFAVEATQDHKRAEALGRDLCKELDVDAVLSIEIEMAYSGKAVYIVKIKWGINGPNPIPKEDKNYPGQKLGSGYYGGQVYFYSYFTFDKPIIVANVKKQQITDENYAGLGSLLKNFAEKTTETWNNNIIEP